jgi:hypothetical protein
MRFLFVTGMPAYVAKNRYSMPDRIEVPKDFNVENLLQYVNLPQPEQEVSNG